MKHIKSLMLATAFATAAFTIAGTAQAQVQDQYIALPSYRVGPYAAGGSGFYVLVRSIAIVMVLSSAKVLAF